MSCTAQLSLVLAQLSSCWVILVSYVIQMGAHAWPKQSTLLVGRHTPLLTPYILYVFILLRCLFLGIYIRRGYTMPCIWKAWFFLKISTSPRCYYLHQLAGDMADKLPASTPRTLSFVSMLTIQSSKCRARSYPKPSQTDSLWATTCLCAT